MKYLLHLILALFITTPALSDPLVLEYRDGVTQKFNPNDSRSGFNLGSNATDPAILFDGDAWVNSTTWIPKIRLGGVTQPFLFGYKSSGGNGSADNGKVPTFFSTPVGIGDGSSTFTGNGWLRADGLTIGTGTPGLASGNPGIDLTRTLIDTGRNGHGYGDSVNFYESGKGYCTYDGIARMGWWSGVTGNASTGVLTALSSVPLRANDAIKFGWLVGGSGLSPGITYYVRDISGSTFKVSLTPGGSALGFSTNITSTFGNPSWMGLVIDHCVVGQARYLVQGYAPKVYGWNGQFQVTGGGTAAEVINFYATDTLEDSNSVGGVTYTGKVVTQYGILLGALTTADYNIAFASTSTARSYHNGRWCFGTNSYSGLDDSAAVQINATSASGDGTYRGLLLPRMTKTQRNTIPNPADGLLIYQTDSTPGLRARVSGAWVLVSTVADP